MILLIVGERMTIDIKHTYILYYIHVLLLIVMYAFLVGWLVGWSVGWLGWLGWLVVFFIFFFHFCRPYSIEGLSEEVKNGSLHRVCVYVCV